MADLARGIRTGTRLPRVPHDYFVDFVSRHIRPLERGSYRHRPEFRRMNILERFRRSALIGVRAARPRMTTSRAAITFRFISSKPVTSYKFQVPKPTLQAGELALKNW